MSSCRQYMATVDCMWATITRTTLKLWIWLQSSSKPTLPPILANPQLMTKRKLSNTSQQYIPLGQGCRMKSTGDTRACNNFTQYSISGTDCPTLWILLRTPWSGGSYTRQLTLCWLDTTRTMEPSRPHPWPVRGSFFLSFFITQTTFKDLQ